MKAATVFIFLVSAIMFCTARASVDYIHASYIFASGCVALYCIRPERGP